MKNRLGFTKLAVITASVALLVSGCTSTAVENADTDDNKGAIAMSFPGLDIQIWNDMLPILEKRVTDAGYDFVTHDPAWNVQAQVADWESWIARGDIKAIMGYPAQADAMIAVTERATDMGIPVVGYGSTWAGVQAAVYFDYVDDGRAAAQQTVDWIRENYGDEIVDVAFLGYPDTDLGRLRGEGVLEVLNESGLNLNITEYKALTLDDGYSAVQTQLNAFPDTKVWFAISNDMATGAYQALIDSGVDPQDASVLLASFDATDVELEVVAQEGSFWRFIFMTPTLVIAEKAAQMMIDAAEGKELNDEILPLTLVTSENAEDFLLVNQLGPEFKGE